MTQNVCLGAHFIKSIFLYNPVFFKMCPCTPDSLQQQYLKFLFTQLRWSFSVLHTHFKKPGPGFLKSGSGFIKSDPGFIKPASGLFTIFLSAPPRKDRRCPIAGHCPPPQAGHRRHCSPLLEVLNCGRFLVLHCRRRCHRRHPTPEIARPTPARRT